MKMTPTCEVVAYKVSEAMDHKLSLWDRIRVNVHLMGCHLCNRYREQLLALRKMLHSYSDQIKAMENDSSIQLETKTKERIKERIYKETDNDG